MIRDIFYILINDSMKVHGYEPSSSLVSNLIDYFLLDDQRSIGIDEKNKLYVDKTYKIVTRNESKSFFMLEAKVEDHLIEKKQTFFNDLKKTIEKETDLQLISLKTSIPLARLTNDYQQVYDLNDSYVKEILNKIYEDMKEVLSFLRKHGLLMTNDEYERESYRAHKVREFLRNEINKSGD